MFQHKKTQASESGNVLLGFPPGRGVRTLGENSCQIAGFNLCVFIGAAEREISVSERMITGMSVAT